jgi:hypothetical protein
MQPVRASNAEGRDSHWPGIYKEHLPFAAHHLVIAATERHSNHNDVVSI